MELVKQKHDQSEGARRAQSLQVGTRVIPHHFLSMHKIVSNRRKDTH